MRSEVPAAVAGKLEKPILFLHIPKTAGTSFRRALENMLGCSAVCYDYGAKSSLTNALVLEPDTADLWDFKRRFDAAELRCLAGHVSASRYVRLFGAEHTVAFMRDPVQRVLSEYHHFVRHYGYTKSILSFAAESRFKNKQQRQLSPVPLAAYGFVGIAERFADSVAMLNAEWRWNLAPGQANVGRPSLDVEHEADASIRAAILGLNQRDQALYDAALGQFQERYELFEHGLPFTRSHVKGIEAGFVTGWAVRRDESAVPVQFLVNGDPVGCAMAHEYRPWPHALGIGRGGYVGFRFRLPGLKVGDEVLCRAEDTGQHLSGNPMRVMKNHL